MKNKYTLALIIILLGLMALAAFGAAPNEERIADAIYKAEGGARTKHPYGVLYVKDDPRTICLNTIRNNYVRWQKAGSKGDFIEFLGSKYCPTDKKTLSNPQNKCNIYWIRNVKFFLQYDTKTNRKTTS